MLGPARLHPEDVEAIARRSAELVLAALDAGAGPQRGRQLVDAAEIARCFGVDRGWVYAHAGELGAVRLGQAGGGRRPRLRFDPDYVMVVLASRAEQHDERATEPPEVAPGPGRRRRRTAANGAPLLPIRGEAA